MFPCPADAMSRDDWNHDEDWAEDDSDPDVERPARCPECGGLVHRISECCPACGYWLSEADRRSMWSSEAKPMWLRVTAVIVLISFLVTLLVAGLIF